MAYCPDPQELNGFGYQTKAINSSSTKKATISLIVILLLNLFNNILLASLNVSKRD